MDLTTRYLGLTLRSPLVPSASTLCESIDNIRQMEAAGAAAVVLQSLFAEQITLERLELHHHLTSHADSFAEAQDFFPQPDSFSLGPEEYLEHIHSVKAAVQIPVIASLNGKSPGSWTDYARKIEQAGADALELNIYDIPTDPNVTSAEVEQSYLDVVKAVRAATRLPIAVKLSPFFTNMSNMAFRLVEAGADSLVLFNRFYQPDIDMDEMELRPNLLLSTPHAMRLPLTWIGILYGRIKADIAATSGIHTPSDALKMLMVGASVTMLCSTLYKHGIPRIRFIEEGMRAWMEAHEYESVSQMQGSMSQISCPNPSAYERVQYIKDIHSIGPKQLLRDVGWGQR